MEQRATALGLLALAIWSTSNAISQALVAALGPFAFLALGFGGGGLALAGIEGLRQRRWDAALRPGWRDGLACGSCFFGYAACYGLAWQQSPDARTTLVLGLVNYLWPSLVLLISLGFFPARVRPLPLVAGVALGLLGIALASVRSLDDLAAAPRLLLQSPLAFALMLAGALCWGLYTNLARRGRGDGSGVALYELCTGGLFLLLQLGCGRPVRWDPALLGPAAFHVLAISALAYALWEHGVQRGSLVTLGLCAYGLPVAATAFTCLWLDQRLGPGLLLGSAAVAGGALLCRAGIAPATNPPGPSAGSDRSSART